MLEARPGDEEGGEAKTTTVTKVRSASVTTAAVTGAKRSDELRRVKRWRC
jgi:hypothetical protein